MFAGPRHDYCGPLPLCHGPLTLLSEQKLFGDSIIGIVNEKNQNNEKLLTDKTGRFSRKAHTGKVAIGTRLIHLFPDPTPLGLRGCEG
jgi:hypothetical protein